LATALAALLRGGYGLAGGQGFPLVPFLAASTVTAWFAGLGPALIALGLGFLTALAFFYPPFKAFDAYDLMHQLPGAVYWVFGVGGAILMETLRSARHRAEANLRESLTRQDQLEQEIAERRRLEEALRESEGRHRALCELNSDFTYTAAVQPDGSMEFESATEGITMITGFTLKELNARGGWAFLIHPEDQALAGQALQRVLGGETVTSEARCRTRTGALRWLRYLGRPEWDAEHGRVVRIVGAVQDITAGKQAQEALEASERRFRSLIEKGWDAFGLINARGNIGYASPSTARILGFTTEELIGRNALEMIHPEDVARIWDISMQLLQDPGGSRTAEYRFPHKDGSWRWLETAGTNLLAEPTVQAIVVNLRDITEQRRLEEELRRHAAGLQDADRRKNEFLAMLAHELRNPLAPLRNALYVLKQSPINDSTGKELRELMERQVRHLARLVDDLLDVSRITQGKIQLRQEVVDLVPLVSRTIEALRPAIASRHHELVVTLPDGPVRLEADPTRLEQVLTNLLTNAAKYTDPGGRIWLTVRREATDVVIRVRDSGAGIAPALLPHVFDLFVQADGSPERSQGGLGIGLTLVRQLVEMHGGTVGAASAGLGKGSEFTIRLPVRVDEPPGPRMLPQEADVPVAAPARRVLAVDDNVDAVESLALMLRLQGQEVRVAYEAETAVALAEEFRPQVVLLDLAMPGLDGYEVARRLRRLPGLEGTLLVALTGWGQEDDRRHSREAGFDLHLVKPVEPGVLRELLAHLQLDAGGAFARTEFNPPGEPRTD
jgi:PAS domain S-box-containing protein